MKKVQQFLLQSAVVMLVLGLSISVASAQWKINEGFEGGSIPAGWITHDSNGDGNTWFSFQHTFAYSGTRMATVECYNNNGNDWLITPQVNIVSGDVFTFYARAWHSTEKMEVKLSTTGTATGNFSVMLESVQNIGTSWTEYSYDLSDWAGQNVYLAIHWIQDTYALCVDDVKVGQAQALDQDAGIASIESPANFHIVGSNVTPSATVKNFGTNPISAAFPVQCIIKNAGGTTIYDQTVNCTNALAPNATTSVAFPNWTPSATGYFTVTIQTLIPNDITPTNDAITKSTEIVLHYGTGGPDAQGYFWIDSDEVGGPTYSWIEISSTGQSAIMYGVTAFHGDDNFSEPLPIGFNFPFYGINFDHLHADINGEILFGENKWYTPYPEEQWGDDGNMFNYADPIPGNDDMPNLISVFWDDLVAEQGVGNVYFQSFGSAPNRYFVVQWNNLKFAGGTGGSSTICFQVVLHENGNIVMQYKNVENGHTGIVPHNYGQSVTVAIQNGTAEAGLCYLTELVQGGNYISPSPKGNILKNNFAVKFYAGEDNYPPLFTHQAIWNTFQTSMEITATITDIAGIFSDTLYYNYGSGWQAMTHTSFESPNVYHYLLSGIPKGTNVLYYFAATDNSTNRNRGTFMNGSNNFSFQVLPMANSHILLASPGNIPGFQDYQNTELPVFMNTLDQIGVQYDVYNWAAYEEYSFPDEYDIIFAYANSPTLQEVTQKFSTELMNFLDKGTPNNPQNLFFASDNFGVTQHPLSNNYPMKKFFQAYLRASYLAQGIPQGGTNGIGGPSNNNYEHGSIIALGGSPIGTQGQIIPVYANSPDVLVNGNCPEWYADEVQNPEISSWGSYVFHDGPIGGNAYSKSKGAALWLDNLIYKTFFISFDMSQFVNPANVKTMFEEALVWFGMHYNMYTVDASVEPTEGGTISPSGTIEVMEGNDIIFNITPNQNYIIEDVLVDNVSIGAVTSHTIQNIAANHTIKAIFQPAAVNEYTITATVEPAEGGTISPSGVIEVLEGEDITFNITPNQNYVIEDVLVDGVSVGVVPSHTFENIQANHAINAKFRYIHGIDNKLSHISIYPNPTSGIINVNNEKSEKYDISITDVNGKMLREINNVKDKTLSIDLSDYPNGIYFIHIDKELHKVIKK